ncbi:MAG: hypothetical protein JXB05_10885 [Myxococcaceae bacterium]|nr:hypothetical protein [Myxococcaceae bacterium]
MPQLIYLIHSSPGRTRLRLPWLRRDATQATPLAEGLQQVRGMEEVELRPYTGSVLCMHDPHVLGVEALLEEVKRLTRVARVVRPGEEPPEEEEELLRALSGGSGVARAASRFFKGLNVDVLRATEGHVDLGTLATLGFMTAGAVEVVITGKLPFPQWFNLGWWAFRTFTSTEKAAIDSTRSPLRQPDGERSGPTPVPPADEVSPG